MSNKVWKTTKTFLLRPFFSEKIDRALSFILSFLGALSAIYITEETSSPFWQSFLILILVATGVITILKIIGGIWRKKKGFYDDYD